MERNQWEWFERIYDQAESSGERVPWDRGAPYRHLVDWAKHKHVGGAGKRAVVVGCGTGDDAEFVASLGYNTTAFDIVPAAVSMAEHRYPSSAVTYVVADLFALPGAWRQAFDLVVENQTAQALPSQIRSGAIDGIASLVAPGGTLLFLANRAVDDHVEEEPPYSMHQGELDKVLEDGLIAVSHEKLSVNGQPRWRAIYTRP